MDSPDGFSKSGADVCATEGIDASVLTSEERLEIIKDHLRDAIDECGVAMRANNLLDTTQAGSVANLSIRKALFSCDAQGGMSRFFDDENRYINRLRHRNPEQIGELVSTTVHLLTALESREEPVLRQAAWDTGKIESHSDRSMTQRLFLSQFITCLDEVIQEPTVDNMIKTQALVSAYMKLEVYYLTEDQQNCIDYCMDFEKYMAKYFIILVEGKEKIDVSDLQLINLNSRSLLEEIHLDRNNVN